MPRKTSPARLAEFKVQLDFARALQKFLKRLHPGVWNDALPDGTSYFDRMMDMGVRMLSEGVVSSEVMTGWKQATADMLEMTRDLHPDGVGAADKFLVSASALSLTEMRRRVWRVIPKVLARGRIRSIDEFYVIKNVLDDDGENLSDEERARLDEMRSEFETRSPHGPPSTRRRAHPRSRPDPSRPRRPASRRGRRDRY